MFFFAIPKIVFKPHLVSSIVIGHSTPSINVGQDTLNPNNDVDSVKSRCSHDFPCSQCPQADTSFNYRFASSSRRRAIVSVRTKPSPLYSAAVYSDSGRRIYSALASASSLAVEETEDFFVLITEIAPDNRIPATIITGFLGSGKNNRLGLHRSDYMLDEETKSLLQDMEKLKENPPSSSSTEICDVNDDEKKLVMF